MRILLVEDDGQLSADLTHQLECEGFEVVQAYDAFIAEKLIHRQSFSCMLLDVNIPGKNGYELAKLVRGLGLPTPIIMITAFGEIDDKLQGFESGVDDYITKPFFFKELLARIRVFLKRVQNPDSLSMRLVVGDLVIDKEKKVVQRAGQVIKLTAREYELLEIMADAGGNPVSKRQLLEKVWGATFEGNTNTVEVFINLLRNKIDKQFETKLIKTRVGFGYYLAADE